MIYAMGTFLLQAYIKMPAVFDAFCVESEMNQTQKEWMIPEGQKVQAVIEKASCAPKLSGAVRRAALKLITVWEVEDGWIYEDTRTGNYLTVTRDYTHAWFYCLDDRSVSYEPLIHVFVECCMIYSGISILHASCVSIDGRAVLFSAPSGTGKSTRAQRWVEQFGAVWISGDRPAISPQKCLVYGVPWDGKEQIFANASAKVQAITEIRRSDTTLVRAMSDQQKRQFLAAQLLIPMWDPLLVQKAFLGMKQMIDQMPVYRLYCDITEQSTALAYEILFYHPEKILSAEEN